MAWLLAQGEDIALIPGTKRVSRVEENTAADGIELSPEQIERLNNLSPATGERHERQTWPSSTLTTDEPGSGAIAIERDVADRNSLEAVAPLARRKAVPRLHMHRRS